jgi:hypothetical protein
VYNCDYCVEKHSESLREAGKHLKNISGINSEGWSLFKLAKYVIILCAFDKLVIWVMGQWPKAVKIVYEDIVWALGIRNTTSVPFYVSLGRCACEGSTVPSDRHCGTD